MKNEFYTANSLAKQPDFPYKSNQTIRRLILSGKLRGVVEGEGFKRRYLIHQSAIDEFIAKLKYGK